MKPLRKKRKLKGHKSVLLALAISSAAIYPAYSDECSDMMGKVTEALATTQLSSDDTVAIEAIRTAALEKQNGGDVEGCVADLQEAARLLNLE